MSFSKERLGCPGLFQEIAHRKPLMHCFGHIHEAWGTKLVQWRHPTPDLPSHFNAIENQGSCVIDSLARLRPSRFDSVATIQEKEERREYERERVVRTRHCEGDEFPVVRGSHTLFVNAAVQGLEGILQSIHGWWSLSFRWLKGMGMHLHEKIIDMQGIRYLKVCFHANM
ncbi:hypothetical protein BKA59DRAFT_2353 [Fusarium tricinctum]|uniref:Uncharacterized protein n=1 Tax=Fusarium tricinctum TaxID=61284 RepID=A0A8K0S633_9HYPO|nr:hypothetical protein BKA59DRAFT_2353 [Fusarium tricinctum]